MLTPKLPADAYALVIDPAGAAAAGPVARRLAWAMLMTSRGHNMAQRRLNRMAVLPNSGDAA